ncbi:hypothetical protein NBRC116583_36610 [Arenicella sp. 4NH20-0111]|uniref:hypothetical protein n=1 Tax=Arenicella sp. 4NH20-0111 TaxID=3127648 RepID=UPI003104A5D1
MKNIISRRIFALAAALAASIAAGNALAAFPDDLDSGVVFIEDGAVPGTADLVRSFAQTSNLEASISGSTVTMNYDKKDSWPKGRGSIGTTNLNCCVANAWAFIKVGDTWYGGTWEFLRNGQTVKQRSALRGSSHLKFAPLSNYTVREGDVIGLMVAGITRNGLQFNNVRERTNIVFYKVGQGEVDPSELGFGEPTPTTPEPSESKVSIAPILELLREDEN